MNGFDIVTVIAIILFARLGVRLVSRYIQIKKEKAMDPNSKEAENESPEPWDRWS